MFLYVNLRSDTRTYTVTVTMTVTMTLGSENMIDAISIMLTEVTLEPDEVLYHQQEVAKDMYLVVSGNIDEISDIGDVEALHQQLRPGNTSGEISFFFKMRSVFCEILYYTSQS